MTRVGYLPSINDDNILKTTNITSDLNWKEISAKPMSNSGLKPNKIHNINNTHLHMNINTNNNNNNNNNPSFMRSKLNKSIITAQENSSPNVHLSMDLVHNLDSDPRSQYQYQDNSNTNIST